MEVNPKVVIIINGVNVTGDISPFLQSCSYTDKVHGESDEIELAFDNSTGFWFSDWLPVTGDLLDVRLGYGGDQEPDNLLKCGQFTIDEVTLMGAPNMIVVRGLATGITHPVRTRKSHVFEKQLLADIVRLIATKNNLAVAGDIQPHFIEKSTQYNESDLSFLSRLLSSWGYVFNVRSGTMYVYNIYNLEGKTGALALDIAGMTSYEITQKTSGTVKKTTVAYFDPDKLKVVQDTATATGTEATNKNDTLEIRGRRYENEGEAKAASKAATHASNSGQVCLNFSVPGATIILAGNNLNITGFGDKLSGKYHVITSTHTISAGGGYITAAECKKVG